MAESPEEYLSNAPEQARPWLEEFWGYVLARWPGEQLTMFRGVPMVKFADSYLKGYVMFTAASKHFAVHAIDFDLIEKARTEIPKAKGGKGSVTVGYDREDAKPALRALVDAVMERHERPRAAS